MASYTQPASGNFRHGLCDCCDSCSDCLLALLCPNCYACCAAQIAGEDKIFSLLSCILFPCCVWCLRWKVRETRGIKGGCCSDCLVSHFLPCCAIIQLKREFSD